MKECPQCRVEYQDDVAFCERCGSPTRPKKAAAGRDSSRQGKKKTPVIVGSILGVVAIAAIAVVVALNLPQANEEPAADRSQQEAEQAASIDYKTMFIVNAEDGVSLHAEADSESGVLCVIPLGDAVSFIENSTRGYARVVYEGQEGYVPASHLSTVHPENEADSAEPEESAVEDMQQDSTSGTREYETLYVVNCHKSITLRSAPDTSASALAQIPLGASVSYVQSASNGFYKVTYLGKTGFALASYLDDEYTGGSNEVYESQYVVVNCKVSVTLRNAPSTAAKALADIPLGAVVYFDGYAENGFYAVTYGGKKGYALAQYLEPY